MFALLVIAQAKKIPAASHGMDSSVPACLTPLRNAVKAPAMSITNDTGDLSTSATGKKYHQPLCDQAPTKYASCPLFECPSMSPMPLNNPDGTRIGRKAVNHPGRSNSAKSVWVGGGAGANHGRNTTRATIQPARKNTPAILHASATGGFRRFHLRASATRKIGASMSAVYFITKATAVATLQIAARVRLGWSRSRANR